MDSSPRTLPAYLGTGLESRPKGQNRRNNHGSQDLKSKTAAGKDGVTNVALKIIVRCQPEVLQCIFDKCVQERHIPSTWKRSQLVLIKKTDKPAREPSSYRPLGLLDCAGKLLEKIIDNRLRDFLETDAINGLSENQYGFRRGRSTL